MTVREHAEAILADHGQREHGWNECLCGDFFDTCRSRLHAQGILDELEASKRTFGKIEGRIIHDPRVDAPTSPDAEGGAA